MPVDLHTHSTASDGSDTPTELVERAASKRLAAIALTDHDTLEGIDEARAAADGHGVHLIPGTEISLAWEQGGMHLVVLWLEPVPGPLQNRLGQLQSARAGRNEAMVARLQELGLDVTLEEVVARAGGGSVGRPHMAAVLVDKGYASGLPEAFDLYLAKGRAAYVGRPRLSPEEAISLARGSGAVPVLAHPHTLGIENRFQMADLLERLVAAGLVGIECYYGTYEQPGRLGMVALARRFDLVPSGGSDFHGTYKPDIDLGTGKVGHSVPDWVLEELSEARQTVIDGLAAPSGAPADGHGG